MITLKAWLIFLNLRTGTSCSCPQNAMCVACGWFHSCFGLKLGCLDLTPKCLYLGRPNLDWLQALYAISDEKQSWQMIYIYIHIIILFSILLVQVGKNKLIPTRVVQSAKNPNAPCLQPHFSGKLRGHSLDPL